MDFQQVGVQPFTVDEPPPLGGSRGPSAARMLGASLGNCLGASLLFCLRKARLEVNELRVVVQGQMTRNERGRLRVSGFAVRLEPSVPPEQRERMTRCLEIFEDFCIISQSLRQGIDVQVVVEPNDR